LVPPRRTPSAGTDPPNGFRASRIHGGNGELAPPVIISFGSVMGTACPNCTIDVYSDDEDEAR
jgi:hypothetical protein